jgi:hypothetical protein
LGSIGLVLGCSNLSLKKPKIYLPQKGDFPFAKFRLSCSYRSFCSGWQKIIKGLAQTWFDLGLLIFPEQS